MLEYVSREQQGVGQDEEGKGVKEAAVMRLIKVGKGREDRGGAGRRP